MFLETKKTIGRIPFILLGALLMAALVVGGQQQVMAAEEAAAPSDSQGCVDCHQVESPGIVGQWKESKHFDADIGCIDCHEADKNDIDAVAVFLEDRGNISNAKFFSCSPSPRVNDNE